MGGLREVFHTCGQTTEDVTCGPAIGSKPSSGDICRHCNSDRGDVRARRRHPGHQLEIQQILDACHERRRALAPEPGARGDDRRLGNPAFCRNADLVGSSLCAFNHPLDARQLLFRFGELHDARGRQCYPARSMASARTDHWHVGIIHLRMDRKCSGQHHDRCWKVRYVASETRAFRRWSSIISVGQNWDLGA